MDFFGWQLTFSLAIFYWLYLVLIVIYCLISLTIIYHLVKFGFFSLVNIGVVVIYLIVSIWLIWFSLSMLSGFNWNQQIFDTNWFNNFGGFVNNVSPNPPGVNVQTVK